VRILVCDTYYLAALEHLYRTRPGLEEAPYAEQLAAVMDVQLGTADAYSHHLRELGHEAEDVILNWEPLQRAWAREHGTNSVLAGVAHSVPTFVGRALRQQLLHRVAHEQIRAFDPDVLYVQDLWFFTRSELARMRRPGRLIVGQLGSRPPGDDRLREYDLILTSFPHYVQRLRADEVPSEYFAIAFYDRLLERLRAEGIASDPERDEREIDAAFVGGIHAPEVDSDGTALLERIAADADVQFWGYVNDVLREDSPITARHRGEAWGMDMYRVLARSKIAINRHGDIAGSYANNMRLYEATGVGALLMTEEADNLPGLYEPGTEIVTYRDADDLVEKVRYYLAHDDERRAIAAAGQRRTLAEHTYAQRMAELATLLETRLG